MTRHTHDAVVLAAAVSWRLGPPKAGPLQNGETLLARTLRLVAETAPRKLVVVLGDGAGHLAGETRRAVIALNPRWTTGLASSLQVAAGALSGRTRPVLVAAIDQPALAARHLQSLLHARDAGAIDVATDYGGSMGIPVVVDASTLAAAWTLEGHGGFRELWAGRPPALVAADGLDPDLGIAAGNGPGPVTGTLGL